MYLRRAVKRRFGTSITVRLLDAESLEARRSQWAKENLMPVVIIDGQVFLRGSFSLKEIIQELYRLKDKS